MSNDVYVTDAGPDQIETIRDLAHRIWPRAYAQLISDEQISYMLELMYSPDALLRQMSDGHAFLLCVYDDAPVGFASYSRLSSERWRLHKLYVDVDKQKSGLGKKLLQSVVRRISEHNAGSLELNVNKRNPAIGFYRHLGFVAEREEVIDIGQGFVMDDYVMVLALQPSSQG